MRLRLPFQIRRFLRFVLTLIGLVIGSLHCRLDATHVLGIFLSAPEHCLSPHFPYEMLVSLGFVSDLGLTSSKSSCLIIRTTSFLVFVSIPILVHALIHFLTFANRMALLSS